MNYPTDTDPELSMRLRPDVIRLTVMGTDGSPLIAPPHRVVHLPPPKPLDTLDTEPFAVHGWTVAPKVAHLSLSVNPDNQVLAGGTVTALRIPLPFDDGDRFVPMCAPGGDYPYAPTLPIAAELWMPTALKGQWLYVLFPHLSTPEQLEIGRDTLSFQCQTITPNRWAHGPHPDRMPAIGQDRPVLDPMARMMIGETNTPPPAPTPVPRASIRP